MQDWKDALAALGGTLPEDAADAPAPETAPAPGRPSETLHIVMERKGRGGKTATIVEGFECDEQTLSDVARRLRQHLGTGGSARGGEILLQGDCRQKAAALLRKMGYKVKGA